MFRRQSIGIAFAILLPLCFVLNSSDAASITSLSASPWEDNGDGANVNVTLGVDADIDAIDWYIDGTYEKTTQHGPGTRWVYESFSQIPGSIKGEKHKVEAIVEFDEGTIDTETDPFRVYKPVPSADNGFGEKTGAFGYIEISSFYYDGSSVVMSSSVYAYNPSNNPKAKDPNDNPMNVTAWFRTKRYTGLNGREMRPEQRDTKPTATVKVSKAAYFSPDGMVVDRWVGTLGPDDVYFFDAHTHLVVSAIKGGQGGDHWEADTGVLEFTWKDK